MTKIKGHSSCPIFLEGNTVYKYPGKFYSYDRLYKQYLKQIDFLQQDYEITTPYCKWVDNHIEMEYVDGYNWVEFCCISTNEEYSAIVNKIINFVKNNEHVKVPVNLDIFQNKFDGIYNKTLIKPDIIRLWHNLRNKCKDLEVPYGYCMGDLSLSNILIGQDKQTIYFIDFLDTFFDCPLMDFCKLKQSTHYYWDLELYDQFYDKTKVVSRLQEFDREIDKHIDVKSPQYLLFQYFNLLRILPYTTDKYLKQKVEQWILSLY